MKRWHATAYRTHDLDGYGGTWGRSWRLIIRLGAFSVTWRFSVNRIEEKAGPSLRCRIEGHRWQPWGQFRDGRTAIDQWCYRCPATRSVPSSTSRAVPSSSWPSEPWLDQEALRADLDKVEPFTAWPLGWVRASDADTSPSPKAKDTGSRSARNGASR